MGQQMLSVDFESKSVGVDGKNRLLTMTVKNPKAHRSVAVATPGFRSSSMQMVVVAIHGVALVNPIHGNDGEKRTICEYCPIDSADFLIIVGANDHRGKLSQEDLQAELPKALRYGRDYRARYDNFFEETAELLHSKQRNK